MNITLLTSGRQLTATVTIGRDVGRDQRPTGTPLRSTAGFRAGELPVGHRLALAPRLPSLRPPTT
ncbi:MAG: hypothetical protein ACLRM9_01190 [Collinsella aerofaciens]